MNAATKSAIWRAQRHLLAVASPNWMRRLRLTMQGPEKARASAILEK